MATSNPSRDVELNLRVQALGIESLQKLQQEVTDLAADGRIAAESGAALAAQIDKLLENAAHFQSMVALEQAVNDLSLATERSRTNALALAEDLAGLSQATVGARQNEAALTAELREAQIAAEGITAKRKQLALDTDIAEQRTNEYKRAVQQLKREEADANAVVEQRAAALREAQSATASAVVAEESMARAVNSATKDADANATALSRRNGELREARAALEAAGVAATDLSTAERALIDANNDVRTSVLAAQAAEQERIATLRREAEEETRLANIIFTTQQAMREAAQAEAAYIVASFNEIAQAEQRAAQQAKQTATQIRDAFSTLGTKSVKELQDEIVRVRTAMDTLRTTAGLTGPELDRAMVVGQKRIGELERQVREATGSLTLMDQVSKGLSSTVGQLIGGFAVLDIGQRIAKGMVEANSGMEKLRLGLNSIYKDAGLTSTQIEFLYQVANRAGVSVGELQPEFVKFAASMQGANVPLAQSNALFAAVAQSAGTLGLSGDKLSHILDALSQMAAKGTVSMEELRQQLGDSLPGALALTAKGLGITEAELVKLVENGGLLARDLFPALTSSLTGMSGEVNTMSAGWERFKTLLTQTATTIGDAGFVDILKGALVTLAVVLGPIALGISAVFEAATTAVRSIATIIAAVVNRDFKDLGSALRQIVDDAVDRQVKLSDAYKTAVFGADAASDAHNRAGSAMQQAGQQAGGAAGGVQANTTAMQAGAQAAQAGATAQGQYAAAAGQAGAQAAGASVSISRLQLDYAKLATQLTTNVEVADKLVKVREIEGKTAETLAKLTGNERQELESALSARQNTLAALENELKARDAESAALVIYIGQLQQEVALHGDPGGVRAKDIEARQQKLQVLTAEAAKTREQVEAMKLEVAQRDLARKAYEDNSKSLDLLKTSMENARYTLAAYVELQKEGFATAEQVQAATLAVAKAEGFYGDALKDAASASDRLIQSMQAQLAVQRAALALDDARARNLAALAKSTGDSNLATIATINLKENEIKRLNLAAQAQRAEADELAKKIELQRSEQISMGTWTTAKEDEYQRMKASIEAKKLEAEATREQSKAIQQEINDIRNGVGERDASTASITRETSAIREQIKAINDRYRTVGQDPTKTADGFAKGSDGAASGTFTNNLPVDLAFKLKNSGGKGMSADEIEAAWKQAQNAFTDMQAFTKQSPGASSIEYQQSTTELYVGARTAYEKSRAAQQAAANAGGAGGATGAAGGTSHTVTINLAGQSTTINTASAADSTALTQMLSQLQTAAGRST